MSDLGRLFRAAPTGIENFASAAVAIAVNKDPRPMVAALQRLSWPDENDGHPFRGGDFRPHMTAIAGYLGEVQVPLWKTADARQGYLDLALEPVNADPACAGVWVEVKVDAPETGDQLDEYAKHALLKKPKVPAVITLARSTVRADVACLCWNDLCDAIASVDAAHDAWLSLRDFLIDEWIARPPLPPTPALRTDDFIKVLLLVNDAVNELWPHAGSTLVWLPSPLEKALRKGYEHDHRMVAYSGPIRFGLIPREDQWAWWIAVSSKNDRGVKLDANELSAIARANGLFPQWGPIEGRPEIMERVVPLAELREPYPVEAWFKEALGQLKAAGVIEPYLSRCS
ncbi:MAG: hypothetical protein AB7O28_10670 [Vicinamibacterales bacterium]